MQTPSVRNLGDLNVSETMNHSIGRWLPEALEKYGRTYLGTISISTKNQHSAFLQGEECTLMHKIKIPCFVSKNRMHRL